MKKILLVISVLAVVVSVSFAECYNCGNDSCSTGSNSCSTVECPQK